MIVVSDTTPLNYLVLIDAVDVLGQLFERVYVPRAVLGELRGVEAPRAVREWASSPHTWLILADPVMRLASTAALDDGEADAISLAKELQITAILIDERRGRKVAEGEGLIPVPTLALLEKAAQAGLLDLPTAIGKIMKTSIRLPMDHVQAALARDALRKKSK